MMNQEWNKWLLTTVMLSMAISSTATGAGQITDRSGQAPLIFSDQSYISPAKRAAVDEAVKQGLLSGYPDASFRPSQLLTRQELAVLLAKVMHLQPKEGTASSFADIEDSWAVPYIEALAEAGLINGAATHTYRPSDPVTREELAAIFVRAVNGVEARGGLEPVLTDHGSISPWAEKAVSAALRLGLMSADGEAFNPHGHLERQDIASYLLDIFKAQEQTATIERIDGDMVIIGGKPYLISGALKDLLGDRNRDALEGAVLKYRSVNHSVNDLLRIEITKSGTDGKPVQLDVSGTPFQGELVIAADHIAVKGDSLAQVVLKLGAGSLNLQAKVARVVVDTDQPVKLEGSGAWGELNIARPDARLSLGKDVKIEKLQVPDNVTADKLITNYSDVKKQITVTPPSGSSQAPGTPQSPSGSSDSSDSSDPVPINHAPTVANAVYHRTGYTGLGSVTVELQSVFADADGDTLSLSAQSSDRAVADVALNGTSLSLIPNQAGTAIVTLRAADGKGGVAQTSFTFTVLEGPSTNHAPKPTRWLDDLTFVEGAAPVSIPVTDLFADEDGDVWTLSVSSGQPSVVEAVYGAGLLTLTPRSLGSASVVVTADDGKGGIGQVVFNTVVNAAVPVNHAPTVAFPLPAVTYRADAGVQTISLASVFADADGDPLTLSAASSADAVATVTVTGTTLTVTPVAAGHAVITITARDVHDAAVTTTLDVTVSALPQNHVPTVVAAPSPLTHQVEDGAKTLSLVGVFADEDGDALTYSAVSSDTAVATVAVIGSDLIVTPLTAGSMTVTLKATDLRGASVTTPLTVTLKANHAPTVLAAPSPLTHQVEDGAKTLSLVGVFADEDGDALTYSAESSDTAVAEAVITGSTLKVTPLRAGSATITVTANDGRGGTVQTSFQATFTAGQVNHQPTVKQALTAKTFNLLDTLLPYESLVEKLDISNVFEDADGDALTYSVTSSQTAVATAAVQGTELKISPLGVGSTTLTLSATDGKSAPVSVSFQVTFQKSGIFFSELVWGPDFYQFIELYNPTNATLDSSKLRIVRSDATEIDLSNQSTVTDIKPNKTFVLSEAFYDKDLDEFQVDSDSSISLELADDTIQSPIDLELYYDDGAGHRLLLDKAVISRGHALSRKNGLIVGSPSSYDAQDWNDNEDSDTLYDGLNSYRIIP
ncbi:S-layer homology domain-containing protein [Paenibacillus filicis]|uniref:S-layer homology domain-containing protein n=1 Tax=Paenibacillus filicis TaxID=669464 RepID=A0ABU9DI66_9BACL